MFSILCFSETGSKDEKVNEKSLYQREGYKLLHQNRKHKSDEGDTIFDKDSNCGTHILFKIEMI